MAHPKEILKTLGASPLKSLSQNFLTSPHWAEKLVESFLQEGSFDEVWEVGPGLGALTEILLAKTKKPVTLFEIDRKLSEYLIQRFPTVPLVSGDFLEYDWEKLNKSSSKVAVLSNLPYHLSSAMIFKMAEHRENLSHFLFTFQKEFADRLVAKPETKSYGALTLITSVYFELRNLGTLPPGAFYPPPSVSSQAILFVPRPSRQDEKLLTALIKAAFTHRRKKMVSNLKEAFPNVPWESIFSHLGLSPNLRAESLGLTHFQKMQSEISNYIK